MSESPAVSRPLAPWRSVDSYMVEVMNHLEAALATIKEMRAQHGERSPKLQPVEAEIWKAYSVAQARRPMLPYLPKE